MRDEGFTKWRELGNRNTRSTIHWCIKSIYNGFAIAIGLYLKNCAFWFLYCSSHVSFQNLLLVTNEKTPRCRLQAVADFFWDLGICEANL